MDSFEYLANDGGIDQEINNRVWKATNIYYQIHNTIVGKKETCQETTISVYKEIYQAVLL